jgi:hypothetical protein
MMGEKRERKRLGGGGEEGIFSCYTPRLPHWSVFEGRLAGVRLREGLLMEAIPIFNIFPFTLIYQKMWGYCGAASNGGD